MNRLSGVILIWPANMQHDLYSTTPDTWVMKHQRLQLKGLIFDVESIWVPIWLTGFRIVGLIFNPSSMADSMGIPGDQTNRTE